MVLRVAVIGAGAAGLCALKHLKARPHVFQPVGFELNTRIGGTWIYSDKTGVDENGLPIHSSMYRHLKTNLPKEVMAFADLPFKQSLPSFIDHSDVLEYLDQYAAHFRLLESIKFQTVVKRVHPVAVTNSNTEWEVTYGKVGSDFDGAENMVTEKFDAVMVCNGHYSVPLIPDIPGLREFQGTVLHSHNYRAPEGFKDMNVVCLGAGASGSDICLDISPVAKQVYLSHNKPRFKSKLPDNVQQKPGIKSLKEHAVIFHDGEECSIDALVFCTGYRFSFPFLSADCRLDITDEHITPLYKHLIHTEYPNLSFIGICKTICPFPQFNNQVRFAIGVLDGSLKLPSKEEMIHDFETEFQRRLDEGLPKRHFHVMGTKQWAYNDELSIMGKFDPVPPNVQTLYDQVHEQRCVNLTGYKRRNYELIGRDGFREK